MNYDHVLQPKLAADESYDSFWQISSTKWDNMQGLQLHHLIWTFDLYIAVVPNCYLEQDTPSFIKIS